MYAFSQLQLQQRQFITMERRDVSFETCDPYAFFRFGWDELEQLSILLGFSEGFEVNRCVASGVRGLCIVMYRLSFPIRLLEMSLLFDRSEGYLSAMFNHVLMEIHSNWKHLLLYDHVRLNPGFLETCVNVVCSTGGQVDNWFAFLDGTYMPVCRPGQEQEELYSGYKSNHSLKYHALSTPDGVIIHLGGPFSGRRHDNRMLTMSHLKSLLYHYARDSNGNLLIIYGDEGYTPDVQVEAPYRDAVLTGEQRRRNESMRRPRLAAEWGFGYISNHWGSVNYKNNLKVYLGPVGLYYPVAAFFCNAVAVVDLQP